MQLKTSVYDITRIERTQEEAAKETREMGANIAIMQKTLRDEKKMISLLGEGMKIMQDELQAVQTEVEKQRIVIAQAAIAEVSVIQAINKANDQLEDVAKEWKKVRSSTRLGTFLGNEELETKDQTLMTPHSCHTEGSQMILVLNETVLDPNTKIYKADPFINPIQLDAGICCVLKYDGHSYLLHNETADCTDALEIPPAIKYISDQCGSPQEIERMHKWKYDEDAKIEHLPGAPGCYRCEQYDKDEQMKERYLQVKYDNNEHRIFCLGFDIMYGTGRMSSCPDYIMRIPNNIPWRITDKQGRTRRKWEVEHVEMKNLSKEWGITLASEVAIGTLPSSKRTDLQAVLRELANTDAALNATLESMTSLDSEALVKAYWRSVLTAIGMILAISMIVVGCLFWCWIKGTCAMITNQLPTGLRTRARENYRRARESSIRGRERRREEKLAKHLKKVDQLSDVETTSIPMTQMAAIVKRYQEITQQESDDAAEISDDERRVEIVPQPSRPKKANK